MGTAQTLWLGEVAGTRAAVLTTTGKRAIGVGLPDEQHPVDVPGSTTNRDAEAMVGARVVHGELVTAAIESIDRSGTRSLRPVRRIEVDAGGRRISRPGLVAVVDADPPATVVARTTGGAAISPRVRVR